MINLINKTMCSSSIICSSRIIRGFSRISEITKFYAETLPKSPDFVPLQFSKERLVDYGELPHG